MELLWLATAIPAVLFVLFVILAIRAFATRRPGGGTVRLLGAALSLALAAIMALVAVGMNGYNALIAERTAATVRTERLGPQAFTAHVTYPDGERRTFEVAGDQLYVDARILKWHPRANLLGLETAYRLDRLAGRYGSIDDEQTRERTVYSLARQEPPVDLFDFARRYRFLSNLVDAEYGSATFLDVSDGGTYQIRVSNSGLLIREVATAQ